MYLRAERYSQEVQHRTALLRRHIACLSGLNGNEGNRFAEQLVSAIVKTDSTASEICQLTAHIGKVSTLRERHQKAAALLSVSRLNASYVRGKERHTVLAKRCKVAEKERNLAEKERDAGRKRITELEALLARRNFELSRPGQSTSQNMLDVAVQAATPSIDVAIQTDTQSLVSPAFLSPTPSSSYIQNSSGSQLSPALPLRPLLIGGLPKHPKLRRKSSARRTAHSHPTPAAMPSAAAAMNLEAELKGAMQIQGIPLESSPCRLEPLRLPSRSHSPSTLSARLAERAASEATLRTRSSSDSAVPARPSSLYESLADPFAAGPMQLQYLTQESMPEVLVRFGHLLHLVACLISSFTATLSRSVERD